MNTFTRHLLSAALLVASAGRAATAQLQTVHAVGGQESVWLVLTDEPSASDEPTHRLLHRVVTASHLRRYRGGQRITGQIRGGAVLGRDLHLFFAGGAHRCYSPDGDEPRVALPDRTPPRAVCADEPTGTLWAIASPTTTTTAHAAPSPTDFRPAAGDVLLRHQVNTWSAVAPIPQSAARAAQVWMCAADGAVHLFWSPDTADSQLRHAAWRDDQWSPPETTQLPASQMLTAFWVNQQLTAAFAPAFDATGGPPAMSFARLTPEGWTRHSVNLSGEGLSDDKSGPTGLSVAPLGQNILIATWSPDGPVATALVSLTDGSVELAGAEAARPVATPPTAVRPTPPWMVAALMAGIMLVLFWRRQSALLSPAVLPAGLRCTALWRRALAFVIDALPAAAVSAPLWHAMAVKVIAAGPPEQLDPATHAALLQAFWLAWAGFRCVQGAYCGLAEALMGSSPGKRLLGSRVVTEGGDRISVGQAILRNLFRIIELEIDPPLLPLILLVGLTRNRQRLGDIVARTVVVEVRAGEPATARPDGNSQDDSP